VWICSCPVVKEEFVIFFTFSVVPSQISGFRTSFESVLSRIRASDTSGFRMLGLGKSLKCFGCHLHCTGIGNLVFVFIDNSFFRYIFYFILYSIYKIYSLLAFTQENALYIRGGFTLSNGFMQHRKTITYVNTFNIAQSFSTGIHNSLHYTDNKKPQQHLKFHRSGKRRTLFITST